MLHAAVLGAALMSACTAPRDPPVILVATHTLEDSGLLDSLAAAFRAAHPEYPLRVVVRATGEALAQARRGDADVVLTHSPAAEHAARERGDVLDRRVLMHNDFLIVGPAADPAGVGGTHNAAAALAQIAASGARFVSRDDSSGTNLRELELRAAAGASLPTSGDAYIRAGVGMADALRIADQRAAYILTDPATYAVLQSSLELVPLVEGDPRLRNTYAVLRVTRAAQPAAARVLADWLIGPEVRTIIARFGRTSYGRPLFKPAAEPAPEVPE